MESWGSVEEMLWVFQNTFLKWMKKKRVWPGKRATQYHIFGGVGWVEELLPCGNYPRLFFWGLLCFVAPQSCHATGPAGSVTGNVTTACGASFIYLPFASQVVTGIEWRRSQWGPASGRSISLFTRMREMGVTQSDTFLTSSESCWRQDLDLTCSFCTLLSFSPWKHGGFLDKNCSIAEGAVANQVICSRTTVSITDTSIKACEVHASKICEISRSLACMQCFLDCQINCWRLELCYSLYCRHKPRDGMVKNYE